MNQKTRYLILAMLLFSTGILASGCIIRARVPARVVVGPPVEYGYQPMLYEGYVVYYTDDGIPFYWSGGSMVYLPVGVRAVYVDHWRAHRAAYIRWRKHRGHYYRSRHYRGRHNYSSARHHERHGNRPVLHPKKNGKPVLHPRKESKPTLKPKKKKKKNKPVLRPKD